MPDLTRWRPSRVRPAFEPADSDGLCDSKTESVAMTNDQISPRSSRVRSSVSLSTRVGDQAFFVRDWLFKARVSTCRWLVAESPGQRAGVMHLLFDVAALFRSGQVGELVRRFYWLPVVLLLMVMGGYALTMAWLDAMRN